MSQSAMESLIYSTSSAAFPIYSEVLPFRGIWANESSLWDSFLPSEPVEPHLST